MCAVFGFPGGEKPSYGKGIRIREIPNKLKNRIEDIYAVASSTLGEAVWRVVVLKTKTICM